MSKPNKIKQFDQLSQKLITEKAIPFSLVNILLAIIFSHLMIKDRTFEISQLIWFLAFVGTVTLAIIPLIEARQEIKRYKRSLMSSSKED